MTVCIAALADNGRSAVLVADQMTTHGIWGWAVESENVPKIHQITDTRAIMTAGDATISHEIVKMARDLLSKNPGGSFIESVRHAYSIFRANRLEHLFLNPRGMVLKDFYDRHSSLLPDLVRDIDQKLLTWDVGATLIAISCTDGVCNLAAIWNPGITQQLDSTGCACIGDGGPHATYAMLDLGYDKALPHDEVKKIAEAAKKRAEKAPSVGAKTTTRDFPFTTAAAVPVQDSAMPTPEQP
jgi:hypothetical protein